jgi:CheY-like chemotaxis protein
MRILLADDNPVIRRVLGNLLKRLGHTAEVACNGKEVLEILDRSAEPFDGILLDVQMPVMNGIETALRVCQAYPDGHNRPPMVAATAEAAEGDREACLAAGMIDLVEKPHRLEMLRLALDRFTSASQGHKAMEAVGGDIDFELFDAFTNEGDEESIEIFHEFCEACEAMLTEMEVLAAAGQMEELAQRAHQLKGTLGAFGMLALRQRMATIEQDARGGSLGPAWNASLRDAFREGVSRLKARLE